MKTALKLSLLAAAAIAVGGCATNKPAPEPEMTPQTVSLLRQQIMTENPGAQVGLVIALLPEHNLASVGDVNVYNFRNGDVLTFVDAQLKPITTGVVVNSTADAIHVEYKPVPVTPEQESRPARDEPGPRQLRMGDLAVRFPSR